MDKVDLGDAIAELRKQLSDSIRKSSDQELKFKVGEVTLEFQIEVVRSAEGTAGIKWVVDFGATGSTSAKNIHTIRIPLTPVDSKDGGAVMTGDASSRRI